jgi:diaminopimelate epimerase
VQIPFFKYQGAGNDFILLDNRSGEFDFLSNEQISRLCDRHFGIGSDGLIKLSAHDNCHFYMDFYNPDATKSFCGNGARCAVAFFAKLTNIESMISFEAIDGLHEAMIESSNQIRLKMNDVDSIEEITSARFELNTGSPHLVLIEQSIGSLDVVSAGAAIRFSEKYGEKGINVNFIEEKDPKSFTIRTYERGVENETLACGTGITAAALSFALKNKLTGTHSVDVRALGGDLRVEFNHIEWGKFREIYLIGPAQFVFHGICEL